MTKNERGIIVGKRLYTGFSLSQFILSVFWRVVLVVALVYFLSKYEENPVLLSALACICFIFILVFGNDRVVVYEDRITQTSSSFLSLAFSLGNKTYKIEDIKAVRLKPTPTKSLVDDTAAVLLAFILPKRSSTSSYSSPIFFDLKNGKAAILYTDIGEEKMKTIIELVNGLI